MSAQPFEASTCPASALPPSIATGDTVPPPVPNPVRQVVATESVSLEPVPLAQPALAPKHAAPKDAHVTIPSALFDRWSHVLELHIKEQTRARRWKYGFRLLLVALVLAGLLWPVFKGASSAAASQNHVALVKLEGTIEYGSPAGAEPMNAALQAAFEDPSSVAVILQMNSPGGSPVQSSLIYDEINRLRSKHNKPIYAVVEELCASGCYYVAAATDDIYVQPASLVGSIGVIMEGFGATELMKKLGVERRIYAAGSNKAMLDPFSPSTDKQKAMVNTMLQDVHQQFILAVKAGRADALNNDPELFSGRVYTGTQSIANGLADEYGTVHAVARDVVGVDNVVDYSPKENIAERMAKKLGASFATGFSTSIANGLWQSSQTQGVK